MKYYCGRIPIKTGRIAKTGSSYIIFINDIILTKQNIVLIS